jgi:hypothetical protein
VQHAGVSKKPAEPDRSLAEKSGPLVERLRNDAHITLNASPRGEVHKIYLPEKIQAQSTHLDLRCAHLYEKAVRSLQKRKTQ